MSTRVRTWLLSVGGALLLASAGAHAFLGWPAVRGELGRLSAPADLVGGLAIGWLFGSAAMLAFGLVVLACARDVHRGHAGTATPALIVGAAYGLFGLTAFLARGMNPHFTGFMVIGALVIAGARRTRRG
jgi:hypothetical protein